LYKEKDSKGSPVQFIWSRDSEVSVVEIQFSFPGEHERNMGCSVLNVDNATAPPIQVGQSLWWEAREFSSLRNQVAVDDVPVMLVVCCTTRACDGQISASASL